MSGDSQVDSSSWKTLKTSVLRRMFKCFTVTSVVRLRFRENGSKNFGRLQEYFTAYMTSQREIIQRPAAAKDIPGACSAFDECQARLADLPVYIYIRLTNLFLQPPS